MSFQSIVLILSLFITLSLSAQTAVPGTHCSMTAPAGYAVADRFTGFQHPSNGGSIMIIEMPRSYADLIPQFTSEAFAAQKMNLVSSEKTTLNGNEAKLFRLTQPQGTIVYNKLILVFAAGTTTVILNGLYTVPEEEEAMKTAFYTTTFNANEFSTPQALFTISTEGTKFIKISTMATSIAYSTDSLGKNDAPLFICSNSVDKVDLGDRRPFAETKIMQLANSDDNQIKSTTSISIDGLNGYEIVAEGKNKIGQQQLVYQVVLYTIQGDYYLLQGTATKDFETTLTTFKGLARTFKARK